MKGDKEGLRVLRTGDGTGLDNLVVDGLPEGGLVRKAKGSKRR